MPPPPGRSKSPSRARFQPLPRRAGHGRASLLSLLLALLCIIWLVRRWFRVEDDGGGRGPLPRTGGGGGGGGGGGQRNAIDTGVVEFVETAKRRIDDAYDPGPVREYCAGRVWNATDAVLQCGVVGRDPATARQYVLNCLLAAIDRNVGFVVPAYRRPSDPTGTLDLDHVFDTELLLARLRRDCQGMPLYASLEAAEEQGVQVVPYEPKNLVQPTSIRCSLDPSFASSFSSLMQYSTPLLLLAMSSLHTLGHTHRLPLTSDPSTTGKSFLAMHLPSPAPPPKSVYMGQLNYYTSLTSWGLFAPVAYMATPYADSGAVREVTSYGGLLEPRMRFVTIRTLLERQRKKKKTKDKGKDKTQGPATATNSYVERYGDDLTREQRSVLDTVMVEHAAYFAGVAGTAFARNAAVVRAHHRGGDAAACRALMNHGKWRDGWSELVGDEPEAEDAHEVVWQWP